MTVYAPLERSALCDLFEQLGPDAATLDEGWDTRMLAAHLVLRDRRPDAAVGAVAKPLAGYTAKVQQQFAARPWPELLGLLRSGPPSWSPVRLVPGADETANLIEYFVHHEDVRRAQPGWSARNLPADLDEALWKRLRGMARLLYRKAPVGVLLHRDSGEQAAAVSRAPMVTVSGPAQELLLHAFGRRSVAQVSLDGDAEAVRRLSTVQLGL